MDEHKLWRRSREEQYNNMGVIILENSFKPCFSQLEANTFVDTRTKEAALTVSPSVVSLISYHGLEEIGWACGIVLESNMANDIFFNTILTSASLLRPNGSESFCRKELKVEVILPDGSICGGDIFSFDFHYNICVITVRSDSLLPTIKLRCVDDTIETTTDAKERSFQLRAHSNLLKLFPGDKFIALGRYHKKPYDLMVAPGKYSIDRCGFDCKELLRVNCKITKCGIGGPMINIYGEVVGINFYAETFTPFLPMNVICKWWEFIKCCSQPSSSSDDQSEKSGRKNVAASWANSIVMGILISVASICLLIVWAIAVRARRREAEGVKMLNSLQASHAATTWKIEKEKEPLSINVATFQRQLRKLKFSQLIEATNGFSASSMIGSGGFGEVFKATLKEGSSVAIKKLIRLSCSGHTPEREHAGRNSGVRAAGVLPELPVHGEGRRVLVRGDSAGAGDGEEADG